MMPELIYPIWNQWHIAYSQPHRKYHTAQHIFYMFRKARDNRIDLEPCEVLAIWLHDYIYDIGKKTNEFDSSVFAREYVRRNPTLDVFSPAVESLILTTRGHELKYLDGGLSSRNIVDLDLWILSEFRESEYAAYVSQIAAEYLPFAKDLDEFLTGRAIFIEDMLARDSIYIGKHATLSMESHARRNLRVEFETMNDPEEYVIKYGIEVEKC